MLIFFRHAKLHIKLKKTKGKYIFLLIIFHIHEIAPAKWPSTEDH